MKKKWRWIVWAALALVLAFYPRIFGIYYTNVFVTFAVFAVYAVSFNLLLGYTGLLSFGHAMFFGAGGYGTALALKHIEGIGVMPALGVGLVAAVVLAAVLAPLVVRVGGTAFAMLHLALGQVFYVLALKLRDITGGEDGIGNFPIPDLNLGFTSLPLKGEPANFYYFATVILGAGLLLMWFFTKTPFGQVQVGVRDNARRIDYLGYKVPQTKAIIYIFSGAIAGLSGAVYGLFHNLVSADGSLGVLISFNPIISTMVGGMGNFFGPVWGTAIFQVIEELAHRFTENVELVIGLILIVVILFAPGGFSGWMDALRQKYLRSGTTPPVAAEEKLEKAS